MLYGSHYDLGNRYISDRRTYPWSLADLFLYSYESEFLQKIVKDKKIHEARAFNFTFRELQIKVLQTNTDALLHRKQQHSSNG
jgi:hypothetical protein